MQVSSPPDRAAGEHHTSCSRAVEPPNGTVPKPPSKSFKQLLTIPQHLRCSSLNRQCKQGRLWALHCLSHLRGLWPRTQTHTHARALLENRAPYTSHHPTLISHLLVHTCAQATEKWTPGVRSGVIHHAASGRRVDIRKGTRSAAIVIESPCLF